jgi:hypothetical protein
MAQKHQESGFYISLNLVRGSHELIPLFGCLGELMGNKPGIVLATRWCDLQSNSDVCNRTSYVGYLVPCDVDRAHARQKTWRKSYNISQMHPYGETRSVDW